MRIQVRGIPAPQGSKRYVGNGRMIESSAKVKPWREAVKWAALEALRTYEPWTTRAPLGVSIDFYLPRPKGHLGTGRNAGTVKASAPKYPTSKPDIDKLVRSTLDGLGESGVWIDDAQVVFATVMKFYADDHPVGAEISIEETT